VPTPAMEAAAAHPVVQMMAHMAAEVCTTLAAPVAVCTR
jgi:hypothetical protein